MGAKVINRNQMTESVVVVLEGGKAKMGKGEVAGMISSMQKVAGMIGPVMFATMYAKFGQKTPFAVAAASIVVAQLIHSTDVVNHTPPVSSK